MVDNKERSATMVHDEGVIAERSRVLRVLSRHQREFASRDVEVDKRVAGALEEIIREIKAVVAL